MYSMQIAWFVGVIAGFALGTAAAFVVFGRHERAARRDKRCRCTFERLGRD